MTPDPNAPKLKCLSVIIPARDEAGCIASTIERLSLELRLHNVPHEIVVVDDGSSDETWPILQKLKEGIPVLSPVQNNGQHGFGRAVINGLDHMKGDAAVIMMADESDDCRDGVVECERSIFCYVWPQLMIKKWGRTLVSLMFRV